MVPFQQIINIKSNKIFPGLFSFLLTGHFRVLSHWLVAAVVGSTGPEGRCRKPSLQL